MTEIEDLKIRVERLEQEMVNMKENLLEYLDIDELSRLLATQIEKEKFMG